MLLHLASSSVQLCSLTEDWRTQWPEPLSTSWVLSHLRNKTNESVIREMNRLPLFVSGWYWRMWHIESSLLSQACGLVNAETPDSTHSVSSNVRLGQAPPPTYWSRRCPWKLRIQRSGVVPMFPLSSWLPRWEKGQGLESTCLVFLLNISRVAQVRGEGRQDFSPTEPPLLGRKHPELSLLLD